MSLFLYFMLGTVVTCVLMFHFGMDEFEHTLQLDLESYVIQLMS
jgi:hypothetical protein